MSKDFPALRMVVEGGRLAPATPFDAERINSYRNKTLVMVKLSPPKDRVQIRKWFAILNLVMKQCPTPWKSVDEAHDAIKLALGIVDLSKTVGGQFMARAKSLTDLDDPELDEAVMQMIDLLSHMTGVDVATLKKEAADVGRKIEQENTDSDASSSSEEPEASPSATGEAADNASSSPASEYQEWLFIAARMLWAATKWTGDSEDNLMLLNNQRKAVPEAPEGLPQAIKDKAGSIYKRCKEIVMHELEPEEGLEIIAGVAGCEPADIGGKNG